MAFLQGPSLKQAEMIKQELGESPGDLERGVQDLRNMLAASPHLPHPDNISKCLLEHFVRGNRLNLSRARTKLEMYCLARVRYRDLYEHLSLNLPPLNEVSKFMSIVVLPKLTDEGYRVTVFSLKPDYPDRNNISDLIRAATLVCEARLHDEHLIAGDVFVFTVSHVRVSIVSSVAGAINAIRRIIHLAHTAYPQRLKRIHIVGSPPFLASSLALMRSFVNEKIQNRYYLHSTIDEILEYISASVLPREWGGEEESLEVLEKKWRHRIDEISPYFRVLNEACNTTPAPLNDVDIYGTVGAFRKLDID